jgi:hypothetical protein
MLFLLAAAVAAHLPGGAAPSVDHRMPVINPSSGAPKSCPPTSRYEAARRGGRLMPQKLNQLPMADAYKAVYRRVGGCVAPIIVKYGIGAP